VIPYGRRSSGRSFNSPGVLEVLQCYCVKYSHPRPRSHSHSMSFLKHDPNPADPSRNSASKHQSSERHPLNLSMPITREAAQKINNDFFASATRGGGNCIMLWSANAWWRELCIDKVGTCFVPREGFRCRWECRCQWGCRCRWSHCLSSKDKRSWVHTVLM
jgi:hypothetical protein